MGFLSKVVGGLAGGVSKLLGGGSGGGGGAPAAPVEQARPRFVPPATRVNGWQADRMAAMRERFSRVRPGAAPAAAAPTSAPAPVAAQPAAIAKKPVTMRPTRPSAVNPADGEVAAYSKAWMEK